MLKSLSLFFIHTINIWTFHLGPEFISSKTNSRVISHEKKALRHKTRKTFLIIFRWKQKNQDAKVTKFSTNLNEKCKVHKSKKKKRKRKFLHSSNRRQRRPCFQTRRSHFLSTKIYIHIHVYIHTHTCIREWSTVSNKTVSSTKPLTVVSRFNTFS